MLEDLVEEPFNYHPLIKVSIIAPVMAITKAIEQNILLFLIFGCFVYESTRPINANTKPLHIRTHANVNISLSLFLEHIQKNPIIRILTIDDNCFRHYTIPTLQHQAFVF